MATLAPYIFQQYFDDNGDPLNAGTIDAYSAGTVNRKNTYPTLADAVAGTNPNANPFTLASDGRTTFYLETGSYDFVIKDSDGNTIDTKEDVQSNTGEGTNSVTSVATMAALKALNAGETDYVDLAGYYAAGDNRMRRFYWVAGSTASPNDGTIIQVDAGGNGRYFDTLQDIVTFKDFGAKGDTLTDDTSAIAAALTWANANNATIFAQDGEYVISSGITIGSNTHLIMSTNAYFSALAAKTININGKLTAPISKIFGTNITAVFEEQSVDTMYPQWWGITGDGTVVDTTAIQACLTAASGKAKVIIPVPPTKYKCGTLAIPSNTDLTIEPGTIMEIIDNQPAGQVFFGIEDVNNVHITAYGATLQMILADYAGDVNEGRHIMNIEGCINVTIDGGLYSEAGGDGIYIRGTGSSAPWTSDNIIINNVIVDKHRRIGITVISGRGVQINNPEVRNGNSTALAFSGDGIHLEPNFSDEYLQNIEINNPWTHDNAGYGFKVSMSALDGTSNPVSVVVNHHVSKDDNIGAGLRAGSGTSVIPGHIILNDPQWEDCSLQGFESKNVPVQYPACTINRPIILNCNQSANASTLSGSAIACYRAAADSSTVDIGNVHIFHPTIIDDGTGNMKSYFYFQNAFDSTKISNITIIDPIKLSGSSTAPCILPVGHVSDIKEQLAGNLTAAAITLSGTNYLSIIHNDGQSAGSRALNLSDVAAGYPEIIVEVREDTKAIVVTPDAADTLNPFCTTVGATLTSSTLGSRLRLKRLDSTVWMVVELAGRWTSENGYVWTDTTFTDNAVPRGNGGGKQLQNSGVLIDDSDNLVAPANIFINKTSSIWGAGNKTVTVLSASDTVPAVLELGGTGTGGSNPHGQIDLGRSDQAGPSARIKCIRDGGNYNGQISFMVSAGSGVVEQVTISSEGLFKILQTMYLGERAAAAADTATQGQFWVENTDPNRPKFTDGEGADFNIIRSKYSTADVSSPPTDAELDAAFGDPTTLDPGFIGLINDAGGGAASYICWTTGTAGQWFYVAGVLAL